MRWTSKHLEIEAIEHHSKSDPTGKHEVWHICPSRPALVLGSNQSLDLVDQELLEAEGIDLVVRRSGGGIVYLNPGDFVWIDVMLPKNDTLYTDDISVSSLWLGEIWQRVLEEFNISSTLYIGNYIQNDICFASKAGGEIFVGDTKLVGVSQRRTKQGIWFQTLLMLNWRPVDFISYLNIENIALDTENSVNLDSNAVASMFFEHISAK